MDLRQLEILRAVADTGSFTAAGHQLHLSQSAVSRQILLLEEELEEQLFLRVGGKIRITPAGTLAMLRCPPVSINTVLPESSSCCISG